MGFLAIAPGCSGADGDAGVPDRATGEAELASTPPRVSVQSRLEKCSQDPRVMAGLVGTDVCAGADIFFRETFGGNGRTCGSCHPIANNLTIDVPFIEALHAENARDPLFVFEFDPELAQLETRDLRESGGILENVDGFEDPANKFVVRSVNHLFSLATSIQRDHGDGTNGPFVERTGWGGDGAPGDGTLRSFLDGAIEQHFTKTLQRREDIDFRRAEPLELDLTARYQSNLGRLNELDLNRVRVTDAEAEAGRVLFLDPRRAGRCNLCHSNAGANFIDTRQNRNFDTGTRFTSGSPFLGGTVNGEFFSDGGFDAVTPTPSVPGSVDGDGNPVFTINALGNGTFNVPPLIEAADTGPFFHSNLRGPRIENGVNFYGNNLFFDSSPAVEFLNQRFGPELETLNNDQAIRIARFLRVLNAAFNASLTIQRLEAVQTLIRQFQNGHVAIQQELVELAVVELDDALEVLGDADGTPIQPDVQAELTAARAEAQLALAASTHTGRNQRLSNALTRMRTGRGRLGTNMTFLMGQSNLMF